MNPKQSFINQIISHFLPQISAKIQRFLFEIVFINIVNANVQLSTPTKRNSFHDLNHFSIVATNLQAILFPTKHPCDEMTSKRSFSLF